MTILFAGTEPDAFKYNGTVAFTTTADYFDATYVRGALYFSSGSRAESTPVVPPVDNDLWFHWECRQPGTNAATCSIDGQTSGQVSWFRWFVNGNSNPVFQYWNGSAYVTMVTIPLNTIKYTVDVNYKNDVDGRIAVYVDHVLISEVTGDFSAYGEVDRLAIYNRATNGLNISQVIIADEPTIGFKVAYRQPTGAGNYTAWEGTFAEVDDAVPTDSSFIAASVNDQRENFTKALFTVPTGYRVKAVGATARARRGDTGPANLAFSLRFGSTDYDSADIPLALDFNPVQAFWHVNPATTIEWTPADAGSVSVEFGVKART